MNRFPRVLGVRPGYDPDEVDTLIRRIEGTLGRGTLETDPITADGIRDARFRVKLGGYHEIAVDYALEAFIVALETRGSSPQRAEPGSPPQDTIPSPAPVPMRGAFEESARREDLADNERPASRHSAQDLPVWPPPPPEPAEDLPRGSRQRAADGDAPILRTPDDSGTAGAAAAGPVAAEDLATADEAYADTWFEAQAARVERMGFRAGRLGMGYNEDEVDAFLDRIVATLRGTTDQPLAPGDVRAATFSTVVFKPGYAIGEVDRFLAELADVVTRRSRAE